MPREIVIIGANAAGVDAAIVARKTDPDAHISVVTDESVATYSRCGLPFLLSGKISSPERLVVYPENLFRMMKLDLRTETRATRINAAAKRVEVESRDGKLENLDYDGLVIATGASPAKPNIEGLEKEGVFSLHTLNDARDIADAMGQARHAVVIGAGYIGLEVAEAFVLKGLKTTVVDAYPSILPKILDQEMALEVQRRFEQKGIDFALGKTVEYILGDERVKAVGVGGAEITADIVIIATGVNPNVTIAKEAGIAIGETGGIKTNKRMETNVKSVFAAGDCAETINLVTSGPALPLLGAAAVRQGKVAGMNVAGGYSTYPGTISSVVSQMFDFEVGATGLTVSMAQRYGFETVVGKSRGYTRASYYPGAKPITVKVVAEKETRRIIGAQIIGGEEVTQRINALSLAIQRNMCTYELVKADTCYAPSVCEASEPMVIAAEMASRKF